MSIFKKLRIRNICADKLITNTLIDLTNKAELLITLEQYDKAWNLLVDANELTFFLKGYCRAERKFDKTLHHYFTEVNYSQ